MSRVIALCGMAGSGKSTVSNYFREKGYEYIHLGATEETIRQYGKTTEELERKVRNEMREKHGMAAMAVLSIKTIKKHLENGKNVIIDNMYSWSEYKYFRKEVGVESFITIAIHANPKLRYSRVLSRMDDPNNRVYDDIEVLKSRDYAEIEEIEKGGPIAMADFNIINEGSEAELVDMVKGIEGNL